LTDKVKLKLASWCGNFIWTADILKKGITTINWAKICSPFENGGLKIINLHHENNVYLLNQVCSSFEESKPFEV